MQFLMEKNKLLSYNLIHYMECICVINSCLNLPRNCKRIFKKISFVFLVIFSWTILSQSFFRCLCYFSIVRIFSYVFHSIYFICFLPFSLVSPLLFVLSCSFCIICFLSLAYSSFICFLSFFIIPFFLVHFVDSHSCLSLSFSPVLFSFLFFLIRSFYLVGRFVLSFLLRCIIYRILNVFFFTFQ